MASEARGDDTKLLAGFASEPDPTARGRARGVAEIVRPIVCGEFAEARDQVPSRAAEDSEGREIDRGEEPKTA